MREGGRERGAVFMICISNQSNATNHITEKSEHCCRLMAAINSTLVT